MTLEFGRNFRWVNEATFGDTYFPRFAGSIGLDVYQQAWITEQAFSFTSFDRAYLLNSQDGSVTWTITYGEFRDQFVTPQYPSAGGSLGSVWSWNLLPGGEYLLVCLDTLETRTYYALMRVNENAPPSLINVYYVSGFQLQIFGGVHLANQETYNDPIIIAYERFNSRDWFYDILPSVNELIIGDISAWTQETSFPFAAGQLPKIEGTTPSVDGFSTHVTLGSLEDSASGNQSRHQFFKFPSIGSTNLHVYADRAIMRHNRDNTVFINPWIKNIVEPNNDQAILTVPFGNVTASAYRPIGAASSRNFTTDPPFVDTTTLNPLPDEGALTLVSGQPSNRIKVIVSSNTVLLNDVSYLPIYVVSYDISDGESAQPDEDLVQYVRAYIYIADDDGLTFDSVSEGEIFNNEENGNTLPHGSRNFWDLVQISSFLTDENELLMLGCVGQSAFSQNRTSVFLTGFGVLSVAGPNRRAQAFLM